MPPGTVACLGASLTAGTVSFNFLDLLEARPALAGFRFLNHGVNGDLAWNALQRLDAVTAERPDAVTILLGTNDINATLSERNLRHYQQYYRIATMPTVEWFAANMRAIIERLQGETEARLALMSLSVIGEDLEHVANGKVLQYNAVIRDLATEYSCGYLPLGERMIAYLQEHEAERASLPARLAYRDGLVNVANATALHANGLSWDEIARRNGLLLTTDCLHLNSVGAGMAADLIEEWLLEAPAAG